jgi:PAS domain S-box-containing protein
MLDEEVNNSQYMANEQNLRILINNMDDPIWLVDVNCMVVECNRSFGKWVAHFIGKELKQGDHVLDGGNNKIYSEKFEMCYLLALKGRVFSTVEDMIVDGVARYTSVSFNPVFENDIVIAVSCFARDITEHRKHLLKIEEQNTALREIAFIESHRVRGPVATLLGLEQLFNHSDYTDPINAYIIKGISVTTNKLDTIIREVVRKSNEIGLQP